MAIWLDWPLPDCVEVAVAAEAAGFSEVWLPDHYFLRDAYAAQALIAERTSRIGLGTAVVSPLLRHPALLASSVSTINELSGGRAIMGVGVGGFEFPTQLLMDVDRPLTIAREAVRIIRELPQGETHIRGERFSAVGAKLVWDGGPFPVYMAARGPKMLELAGEVADGVITHGLAQSYVDFCLDRIRMGAERAGRSPVECELVLMFEVEMRDDMRAAVDHLRPRCTIMAGGEYAESLIPVFGLDPEAVKPLREAVRARDPDAGRLVTDEMVHAFAVAGPPEHLASRLQEMADAGVGRVILVFRGDNPEDTAAKMEQVGKAIAGVQGGSSNERSEAAADPLALSDPPKAEG
ncbi:MAG TPA: LLM class flavin-dependent oxidoreductase [Actinomycetota bacterium]|nr:LLM class flavin-dependent oxidoreductase [Actinomycetota bacterium]